MYVIQEIQTANNTPAFLPAEVKANRTDAESAVYTKWASAAISTVPVHTIITYTEEGVVVPELTKCFKHAAQTPAPEPVVEPEQEEA